MILFHAPPFQQETREQGMAEIRKKKSTSDDLHRQVVECHENLVPGESDEDPIKEHDHRIVELKEKLLRGDQVCRALHNRIQELQGNIRVYIRTRPFLPTDGAAIQNSSIDILPDGESLTILGKQVGEIHAFKFDKVFAPLTGQAMVFVEVSEFVQSALDRQRQL